ncbi:MAG: transmembrane 220 family protein [Flavobacteriaceae bacterium]|nr:transmembrane 220 family protein [Flavobacteriaceae bacterium]
MKKFSKILALIFALLFTWAAFVQHNDPDALLWYANYGVAAGACLLFYFDRFHPALGIILAILYLIQTFLVWPDKFEGFTIGEGDIENIERGREAWGLLLSGLFMIFLSWRRIKDKGS